MLSKKFISVICLTLFCVMFGHTITDNDHHHHDDEVEFLGLHHHCYEQEDEFTLQFDDKISELLQSPVSVSFTSVPSSLQIVSIDLLPSFRLFSRIEDDSPDEEFHALPTGLRAPPAVTLS